MARSQQEQEIEGVFVVRDGIAYFTPVEVGITGQEYFEVISGVQAGDTVVAGPYQRIRELMNEDPVRPVEETPTEGGRSRLSAVSMSPLPSARTHDNRALIP